MKKTYLLTPGPTSLPEAVTAVMSKPIMHHRTPAFRAVVREVTDRLKNIFQTQNEVLLLTSSGTGAMEAAISNLFSPGEKVLVVEGGKFGQRWTAIAKAYGLNPVEINVPWGEALEIAALDKAIAANPDAKAVLFQACETSTGVEHPTQEICQAAKKAALLSICDAITGVGVFDIPMDKWEIDVLITGSQKAFMCPPGLAMISLSPVAWGAADQAKLPRYYFDLKKERKALGNSETTWTPGITQILALKEALALMFDEGSEAIFKRHARLAKATRAAVQALGLELFAKSGASTAVTAVKVPSQISDGTLIPKYTRETLGVAIAGGQAKLEGKIFRLSHFGYCGEFDITTGISALELALYHLGYPVKFGTGVGAVLKVFAEEKS